MRLIASLALAASLLCSLLAQAMPIDGENEATGSVPVVGFDPSLNPVTAAALTLNFAGSDALDPGETVLVRVYDSVGTEVGSSQFTNSGDTSITTCACFHVAPSTDITVAPFSFLGFHCGRWS